AVAELNALQELLGDLGVASRVTQSREPVEAREDAVFDRARLDVTRPAGDARYAETAFEGGPLLTLERRVAAVGPGEGFGAVVGGENDNGVVRLAHFFQVLEERADGIVELSHTCLFQTVVGLAVLQRPVLGREEGPDVHARGVVPEEE